MAEVPTVEEDVACRGALARVDRLGSEPLAEPDDVGTQQRAAVAARRRTRAAARGGPRVGRRRAQPVARSGPARSSRAVERRRVPARSCSPSTFCVMSVKPSGAGSTRRARDAPRWARAPATTCRRQSYHSQTSCRVAGKRLGRGEIFGAKLSPQSAGPAERRNAARRRDAGAGEDGDAPRGTQSIDERIDPRRRLRRSFTAQRLGRIGRGGASRRHDARRDGDGEQHGRRERERQASSGSTPYSSRDISRDSGRRRDQPMASPAIVVLQPLSRARGR